MKTRLIFLLLLIVCISCGTNNKPVSDAQKEKIKGEVKEVANTFIKGCDELNFDMAIEPFLDSPDFEYIANGKTYNYQELMAMRPLFDKMINQKLTIADEKYKVLDNSTVLFTTNYKWLQNYKDGHSILEDPASFMFMFKKINNKWRIIYWVDSWVEQTLKYKEPSKEINQVELMKQFIGNWKCDIAKDTVFYGENKSYGTGIELNFKYAARGKTYSEAKLLWGYDKNVDKYVIAQITKGMDIEFWAVWFISKNKYLMLPYSDISNPDGASFKWEGEIKSPDVFVETTMKNNQPIKTDTYTRIK